MPRRKSGIGGNTGDSFNGNAGKPDSPKRINDFRQGNSFSFKVSQRDFDVPENVCEHITEINTKPIDLISPTGRKSGELVLYDPAQQENYTSQAVRYQKSLKLSISGIQKRGDKTIYLFCSPNSPTGFWEVEVGGTGTYVRFLEPLLTIICPRPFKISEVGGLETDADSLAWAQLQGRATIISPPAGDGSLDPTIAILGVRNPLDPPILIQTEIPGTDLFDILLIDTTATDRYDAIGQSQVNGGGNANPCRAVPCEVYFVPDIGAIAYEWNLFESVEVTWNLPICNLEALEQTIWQINTTGNYVDVQTFPILAERRIIIDPNVTYRIKSQFNFKGVQSESVSCSFRLDRNLDPIFDRKIFFADDPYKNLSQTFCNSSFETTPFTLQTLTNLDAYNNLSQTFCSSNFETTPFALQTITNLDAYNNLSQVYLDSSYHTDSLGGVIIG